MHQLPSLQQLITVYDLQPHKKLGQHFLLDDAITHQMVLSTPEIAGQTVLEVGPGPGTLTRALVASKAAHIIAVELDDRCLRILQSLQELAPNRLEIVHADAMQVDEASLIKPGQQLHIMANLPYNIGTALLCKWLKRPQLFASITIMLQKEVVDRITAQPRRKDYGRLSIFAQRLCAVEELLVVPQECFFPPPKVLSAVVRLVPYPQPLYYCDEQKLERLTNQAFSQRRKMLRSVLKTIIPNIEEQLSIVGASPTARAEELSVEQFCQLAQHIL